MVFGNDTKSAFGDHIAAFQRFKVAESEEGYVGTSLNNVKSRIGHMVGFSPEDDFAEEMLRIIPARSKLAHLNLKAVKTSGDIGRESLALKI